MSGPSDHVSAGHVRGAPRFDPSADKRARGARNVEEPSR
jgi:hypothetical protein